MESQQSKEVRPAGYRVVSILLLESSFAREAGIEAGIINDIENLIDVIPEAHETTPDNKFAVTLTIEYKGLYSERQICIAKIKMGGVFEKYGEPSLPDDKFKSINGPAIIYPFIREHLHNLCLKAGIANVLLPAVNFKP